MQGSGSVPPLAWLRHSQRSWDYVDLQIHKTCFLTSSFFLGGIEDGEGRGAVGHSCGNTLDPAYQVHHLGRGQGDGAVNQP